MWSYFSRNFCVKGSATWIALVLETIETPFCLDVVFERATDNLLISFLYMCFDPPGEKEIPYPRKRAQYSYDITCQCFRAKKLTPVNA